MKTFVVSLALAGAVPAQCLFTSVTTQSSGPSCNVASTGMCAIVALPAWLEATLDIVNCRLLVDVNAFAGCGATVPLRMLAIGLQPASVPLPDLGPGCTLHVQPVAFLGSTSATFALDLPPGVTSFAFVMQGAALSVPPLSGDPRITLSEGQRVSLQ